MFFSVISAVSPVHLFCQNMAEFDQFSKPSKKGKKRLAGIDINRPRCRNVMKALLELSTKPSGFTSGEVEEKYSQIDQASTQNYNPRKASYDLRKLRDKEISRKERKFPKVSHHI